MSTVQVWPMIAHRLPCLAFTFLTSGCSKTSIPASDLKAIQATAPPSSEPWSSLSQAHDFGMIISEDQTLRYEFVLRNPTDRLIRLTRGMALTPCCSSLGPLPESIPPGGVRRGSRLTSSRATSRGPSEFCSPLRPIRRISRQSAWLCKLDWHRPGKLCPSRGSTAGFPWGKRESGTFRVIARRTVEPRDEISPKKISATSPVDARFAGRAAVTTGPDSTIEAARDVVLSIPATNQAGIKRGELQFHWPDGHTDRMPLSWEVRPRLRVIPSGLVLCRSPHPVEQKIIIESDVASLSASRGVGSSAPIGTRRPGPESGYQAHDSDQARSLEGLLQTRR